VDGAIDAKIVTADRVRALAVVAISGPSADTQPVFAWTGPWSNSQLYPHYGHAVAFNFSWVEIGQASYEGCRGV
jgi:hypothetical protein